MYQDILTRVPTKCCIGGEWRDSADQTYFDVVNPATQQVVASVANANADDAKSAVDAAHAASGPWSDYKPRDRAEILRKTFELLIRDADRFATLITIENGKSLSDSRSEISYSAEFFRWYSEEAVRNIGQLSRAPSSGARILVHHKPIGISVLVTPWNFPLAMAARKVAPALAAGCTVILKPAEETPLAALLLVALLEEAGLPPGVVNILPTTRAPSVVDKLLQDARVRMISFTGSTEVGRKILREAANNVVKSAMELGGNAPFIVFNDADIDAAVDGAMIAKMRNIGEACTAANRFYVQSDVHDEFARRLTEKMSVLKMGDGLDEGVEIGPLINQRSFSKVSDLVEDATNRGARLLLGGAPSPDKGYFYPATVLTNVPRDADIVRSEIFGPVAAIQSFTREEEVIDLANDTEYGLVAYVYSRDLARAMRVSESLDFGMVGINRGIVSDPAAVFGGMKQSGLGREGAHEGLMEFLESQYISVSW